MLLVIFSLFIVWRYVYVKVILKVKKNRKIKWINIGKLFEYFFLEFCNFLVFGCVFYYISLKLCVRIVGFIVLGRMVIIFIF